MALRFQQKLIIPSSSRPLIERHDLVSRLEGAVTSKRVVALAAPAGWGKTTALAQWAGQTRLPVAWYTLDAIDRDPQLFLDYLLHAVGPFVPGADALVARLAGSQPQALPELFHAAALAISDAPKPFALVLDDFHALDSDLAPGIPGAALLLDLLASIAEYAGKCHLVFASRTLPALHGLVRMVAQQRAAVFDYAALQMSPGEIQILAGITSGVMLSDEGAERLVEQLGGWVTGIVLSLDHLRAEERSLSGGIETSDATRYGFGPAQDAQPSVLSPHYSDQVYAFFAEQIIAPLPPDLQRFLEETSVLEDLSPQRCNALRSQPDSSLFLDEIKRRGLFVSSRAGWLAYHSLFREFLRTRLARSPQRERDLLRRAGELYRDEDDPERALDCYLAAGADDEAIAMLRVMVPRLRQRSRQATLLACFESLTLHRNRRRSQALGGGSFDERPITTLPVDMLLAQARVYGDLAQWDRAHLILQLVETIGSEAECAEAQIVAADLLAGQGDGARALEQLDGIDAATLPARLQLAYFVSLGSCQILRGEIAAAVDALERAHALAPLVTDTAEDPTLLATTYDYLGWAYATQGNRSAALRYLKRADACWQASGDAGRRTMTLNNLGMVAVEDGRFPDAREAFEQALHLAQQTGRRREEVTVRCSLADLELIEGDLDQALQRFTDAHALAVRMDLSASAEAAAASALWAAALQGDIPLAQAWLDVATSTFAAGQPEVRGRKALGHSLLLRLQPRADIHTISALAAEATAVEPYLSTVERAYLALQRATLTLERTGWPRAAAEWEVFAARAADVPTSLLLRFVQPHRALFDAAATSPLAQRLLETVQQPGPSRWQISALGGFSCLVDGRPVDLSPLHRALLVRLLDAGTQGISVERLWEAVWGDSIVSMSALHQALRRLRLQTGLQVSARDGGCAIRTSWDVINYDVRTFEQQLDGPVSRDSMQRAMALYRGEFLPSAPLSAALWVEARRAHLQQRYLDALEQLAHSVERETPHLAIHYYQQVLQIDGCREQTAAQLMRLAARYGNRSLVTATFEHLKSALRTLGALPEPSTTQLYQQLH